jgi:hypothetical protein
MIGKVIIIVMALFMSMILYFVSIAVNTDFNLVSQTYYSDALLVDLHNEQIHRDAGLQEQLQMQLTEDDLVVSHTLEEPPDSISFYFYSPRTPTEDQVIHLSIEHMTETISLRHFRSGNWQIEAVYSINNVVYRRRIKMQREA